MKKYGIFALAFVLTGALLVGCGCTNQDMTDTTPTVLPTNEEVMPTTRETTQPTTESTEASSVPTETGETIDRGNGALEDTATESTGEASGNARGITGGNGSAGMGAGGNGSAGMGTSGSSGSGMVR